MAAVTVTHKVTHFWTAFFSLLSAILTSLGLKRTPEAAISVYAEQAVAAAPAAVAGQAVRIPAPRCCAPPRTSGHARSLPPTIKQRIRAEAHGASPSVRRLPAALASDPADDAADVPGDPADPSRTGVNRTRPSRTGVNRIRPSRTGVNRIRPSRTGVSRIRPSRTGANRAGLPHQAAGADRTAEAGTAERAAHQVDPVRRTGLALAA